MYISLLINFTLYTAFHILTVFQCVLGKKSSTGSTVSQQCTHFYSLANCPCIGVSKVITSYTTIGIGTGRGMTLITVTTLSGTFHFKNVLLLKRVPK